jgi:hypothetical protein
MSINDILDLKKRVMARIYMEYAKSTFMEYPDYFMFVLFVITSLILVLVHEISVANVLNNMPKNNLMSTFNFFVVAVEKTSWAIQILLAGFLVRVIFVSSKLTYKNIKNIDTSWIMAKLRY